MQLLHVAQTQTFCNSDSGEHTGKLFLFQNNTQDFRIGFTTICSQELALSLVLSKDCAPVTKLVYAFTTNSYTIGTVSFFRTTSCLENRYSQRTSDPFTSLEEAKKVYLKLLLTTQENIL
jgi:hypothetical protein